MIEDEPNTFVSTSKPTDLLTRGLESVFEDGTPLDIWKDGKKVAVAIHPDEFEALRIIVSATREYLTPLKAPK